MEIVNKIKKCGLKFLYWEFSWILKFISPGKLVNFLGIYFQDKYTKPAEVKGFPIKLTVDPSANCVLRCPLCPTGQADKGRKRGEMDFFDFEKLIDEVGQYLFEIDLFNWGEPFLNKDIFRMISLSYENKIITRLSSNLNCFPEGHEKSLVESRLNHLVVSLDGISQGSYEKYRTNGSIRKVLEAVGRIKREKEEQGSKFPFITWQFVVFDHNKHEIEQAKKLVGKWGFDRIVFIENRGDMGKELFVKKNSPVKFNCNFLWRQSVVNWDGSVSPCCLYYEEKYDFGNAFKDGFGTVWNNDNYQRARRVVKSKKYEEKGNILVCVNCLRNGFPD